MTRVLPERVRKNRVNVVGKIAIDGTRKRGDQTVKHFKISEVKFNGHSGIVEFLLENRDHLFHVFPWLSKKDAATFSVKFLFQFS